MTSTPIAPSLVVIGASAGGIEALTTLVSTLPTPFPAPIVVAQHLDPTRQSQLESILARQSTLPVQTVTADTALQSGVIYVVPANRHVTVSNHDVRVLDEGDGRPKPSVDLLLATAAQAVGEELIAVILTGSGSDGADGARAVKEAGGTVIIQNPETASFPSMPLSLAPTTVDIVADLPAIGPLLGDLLSGAYTPPSPDADRRMRALLEQLRTQSGIDFSAYKAPTIQRRLQRRMADAGVGHLDDYLRYLQRNPDEYQRLAGSFFIKVTDFFRDPDLFAYLRETVLPELVAEARDRGNELRVWSAGCATGEEPYSLAILLAEQLGDELRDFTIRIFATDVDPEAITFARRGVYPASALAALPPAMRERYFTALDGAFEVHKRIRGLVVFGQHDLAQRAPFPRVDLVLCRNVLIYFTPELQRRVLQLFAFSLRPGGRLVLGKSETTGPSAEHFALEQPRLKVYRRQGERVLIPPVQLIDTPSAATPRGRPWLSGMAFELARAQRPVAPAAIGVDRADRALQTLPVGVVMVDRHYDVQEINAAARRLLAIHATAIGDDIIHLARRLPSDRLRSQLNDALAGEARTEHYTLPSLDASPGDVLIIDLTTLPQQSSTAGAQIDGAILLVQDVTVTAQEQARLAQSLTAQETEVKRLGALLGDAHVTARDLHTANQELAAANALLRAQNEELQVGNEEAQAAAEEIETLNEEQQATNEELETLNEELQATVEELNTTNEDLGARQMELQTAAETAEAQRARLDAVLASVVDALVAVDEHGAIILTNAAYVQQFGDILDAPTLFGEDGQPLAPEETPHARAARGETFAMRVARRSAGETLDWFEARGQVAEGAGLRGVVIFRARPPDTP
jgi:two-component system CheB/CheR fusion protein